MYAIEILTLYCTPLTFIDCGMLMLVSIFLGTRSIGNQGKNKEQCSVIFEELSQQTCAVMPNRSCHTVLRFVTAPIHNQCIYASNPDIHTVVFIMPQSQDEMLKEALRIQVDSQVLLRQILRILLWSTPSGEPMGGF